MTIQRPQVKNLFWMLFLTLISFSACKKDAIKIDTEKRYTQEKSVPATDLAGGAMTLVLKPDGMADFNPGGDIVYRGNYDISGKKITVKIPDLDMKYKFTIISEQELQGENGEKLTLSQ